MNRPVTLIGLIVLVLAAVLFFAKVVGGDNLTILVIVGVILCVIGLLMGK